jgi:hypothetical protein
MDERKLSISLRLRPTGALVGHSAAWTSPEADVTADAGPHIIQPFSLSVSGSRGEPAMFDRYVSASEEGTCPPKLDLSGLAFRADIVLAYHRADAAIYTFQTCFWNRRTR